MLTDSLENRRVRQKRPGATRGREVKLPPLPPGLEVYRPADVLGSAVLVVEDEAAMLQQLRIDLHDLGYRPSVASSAPEARELLERERMAAVLLDLVLDEGEDSGFDLLQWIRQHHPGLPVIVLSAAQVNSAAIRRAYELGAAHISSRAPFRWPTSPPILRHAWSSGAPGGQAAISSAGSSSTRLDDPSS